MKKQSYNIFTFLIFITFFTTGKAQLISDTSKIIDLNEVIISANKIWENKKEVAQEVQVLGKKQMELIQARSTADLLPALGIHVQKSQLGGAARFYEDLKQAELG